MTMPADTHRCPGCDLTGINPNRLACRDCWYRLPRTLRAAVVASWRGTAGAGSAEHRRALAAAFEWYRDNTGTPR